MPPAFNKFNDEISDDVLLKYLHKIIEAKNGKQIKDIMKSVGHSAKLAHDDYVSLETMAVIRIKTLANRL